MREVKYRFTVSTPYEGSRVVEVVNIFDYILEDDWEETKNDPEWRQELLRDAWLEWCQTVVDGGWERVD